MKRLLLLAAICTTQLAFSQGNELIDSLEQALPEAPDTSKVQMLCTLSFEYGFSDMKKSEEMVQQAMAIAEQLADSQWVALAANEMSVFHFRNGKYEASLASTARCLQNINMPKQASRKARVHNIRGLIYNESGEIDQAIEEYLAMYDIGEELNEPKYMSSASMNLATSYRNIADYPKSIEYAHKALELAGPNGNPYQRAGAYGTLGVAHSEGNLDSALHYLNLSLDLFKSIPSDRDVITALGNLGKVHRLMGNKKQGAENYREALALAREKGQKVLIAKYLNNTALVEIELGNYNKALPLYKEAIAMIEGEKMIAEEQQAYEGLYESYLGLGKYKASLDAYQYSRILKDSIYNADRVARLDELEKQYQTEKTEKELAEEKLLRLEANQAAKAKSRQLWIAIGAALGLLLIGLLLFARNRAKQQAELSRKESAYQKSLVAEREKGIEAVIHSIEQERRRIAKELHDGVCQALGAVQIGLSNLANSAADSNKKEVSELSENLKDSAAEVRNISHQMMPRALEASGLTPALREMLEKSFGKSSIDYSFESFKINGDRFAPQIELNLYRIGQELVSNVMRHSGANKASVQLLKNKQHLVLMVEDNGKGLHNDQPSDGIGMHNIKSRLRIINGDVDFASGPNSGTVVTVRVPLQKAA